MYDKRQPYESDIRVPLLIKGPGIKENVTSDQPILNIDLAPTILALAGLNTSVEMDGRALDVTGKLYLSRRVFADSGCMVSVFLQPLLYLSYYIALMNRGSPQTVLLN